MKTCVKKRRRLHEREQSDRYFWGEGDNRKLHYMMARPLLAGSDNGG